MLILICHVHHSVNNNHSFINFCKHAIPFSVRAPDKVLSKEQALYFILTIQTLWGVSITDYSTAQKYPGYSKYGKQTSPEPKVVYRIS